MAAIRDALLTQRQGLENRLGQRYIGRDARMGGLATDIIKVVMGPRRAGKSFFAIHELTGAGSFGYANFDDETLIGTGSHSEIVSELVSIYQDPNLADS